MSSDPNPPESEDDNNDGKRGASVLVDIFAEGVAESDKGRQSPFRPPVNGRNGPAIPPSAQMVLGAVFGFMTCLIGWLYFTDYLSDRHVRDKADFIIGFLSSGFLTVTVVLAVQGALSVFLIRRKLKFAAAGIWLVYLPFVLFFLA